MRPRRLAALAAAVVTTAAAGFVVPLLGAAPAAAAACSTDSGVTVIADFNELGGGVQSVCAPDGGYADDLYDEVGLELTYAQRQPGFVCRVEGTPASDPCVNTAPADAYWGLWWSDGDPGSGWTYSSLGVGSLKVPDGGLVALAWDQNPGDEKPSAASERPAAPSTPASPTGAPSASPTSPSTQQPPSAGATDGADPSAPATTPPTDAPSTAVPTDEPSASSAPGTTGGEPWATAPAAPTPTPDPATPQPSVEDVAPTAAEPADGSDEGLPGWVAPVLIVLLFAAAGGTLLLRRRSNA